MQSTARSKAVEAKCLGLTSGAQTRPGHLRARQLVGSLIRHTWPAALLQRCALRSSSLLDASGLRTYAACVRTDCFRRSPSTPLRREHRLRLFTPFLFSINTDTPLHTHTLFCSLVKHIGYINCFPTLI